MKSPVRDHLTDQYMIIQLFTRESIEVKEPVCYCVTYTNTSGEKAKQRYR